MRHPLRATSRVLTRKNEVADRRRQLLLVVSAASALTLCSLAIARADSVTVNADGTVTRTQTTARAAMPAQGAILNNGQYNGFDPQHIHNPALNVPGAQVNTGTTTFFAGTYYPIPQNYYYGYPQPHYYGPPQGYTYPVGPVYPRVTPPMITAGPAVSSGVQHHHYYPYYGHYAPPMVQYPAYSYPVYGTSGVYYHGPAGGGGTIHSSSTTSTSGTGLSVGRGGVRVGVGGTTTSTNSTTTVTTTAPR